MTDYVEYVYTDDNLDHTNKYILLPLLNTLKGKEHFKILDLGCGNGSIANKLIQLGYDVYGIDASLSGIEIAKKTNPSRFFHLNLSTSDIPDEIMALNFDMIISTEVIEHLYSPDMFIELCTRILKNSEHQEIVLTTPYNGYLKNLLISIFDKWDHHLNPLWEGGHIKFWSKKTITKLLNVHNIDVLNIVGCGRTLYLWKSMLIHAKCKSNKI